MREVTNEDNWLKKVMEINRERYYKFRHGSATINPSELWMCPYRVKYNKLTLMKDVGQDEVFPMITFAMGKWIEEGIREFIKRAGFFYANGDLMKTGDWFTRLSGEPDTAIIDTDGQLALLEQKTVIWYMEKQIPYPAHILQLKAYQYLHNIKRGYLLYFVKGKREGEVLRLFEDELTQADIADIESRIRRIREVINEHGKPVVLPVSEECIRCPYIWDKCTENLETGKLKYADNIK